jgi:endo-1,4-beta-D-glucanase Y
MIQRPRPTTTATVLLAFGLGLGALGTHGCGSVRGRSDSRPAGGGPSRPFAAHATPYHAGGVILPNHVPRATLDAATAAYYDQWKNAYLEPACKPGEYRIRSLGATKAYAVSEGHGYAMMALPLMAGHDPEAQRLFDGFYRYYKSHGSTGNRELMAWAQNKNCENVGGPNSATDADLDIAYGLLLADRQWGSGGAVDYRGAAEDLIKTILKFEVTPANNLIVGNWVTDARNPRYSAARGSDFMPEHFKAFQRATGNQRWDAVLTKTYDLIALIQKRDSPASGLVPDFIVDAAGDAPHPAPPRWLEAPTDGQYAWNACRVPWRVTTDYLITGDARAQAAVRRMNAWLRHATVDDPAAIRAVYDLGGEPVNDYASLAFSAPFLVAAMVEPEQGSNQPWLNALWDMVAATPIKEYYGDSIKLFAMIVASGNWWSPS